MRVRDAGGPDRGPPCTASGGNMAAGSAHEGRPSASNSLPGLSLRSESDPTVHQKARGALVQPPGPSSNGRRPDEPPPLLGAPRVPGTVGPNSSTAGLAQDDLLEPLFPLHGIHPVPRSTTAREALTQGPPDWGGTKVSSWSGFDDDGVAHCEVSPGGCGAPRSDPDKTTVEKAILDAGAPRFFRPSQFRGPPARAGRARAGPLSRIVPAPGVEGCRESGGKPGAEHA